MNCSYCTSDHGTCVRGVCVCDDGWTGNTDMMSYRGLDCSFPVLGTQVSWGIVSAASFVLALKHIVALRYQWYEYRMKSVTKRKQGKTYRIWHDYRLVILLVGLFVTCTSCFFVGILKIWYESVIGGDLLVTLLFMSASVSAFGCITVSELRTFHLLCKHLAEVQHLLPLLRTRYVAVFTFYSLVSTGALVATCFRPPDPSAPLVQVMFLVRSGSVIAYMAGMAWSNTYILHQLQRVVNSFPSDGHTALKSQEHLQQTFEFVKKSADDKKKSAIFIGTGYIVFCLPVLWPYQTFIVTALITVAFTTKSHYVNVFLKLGQHRHFRKGGAMGTGFANGVLSRAFSSTMSTGVESSAFRTPKFAKNATSKVVPDAKKIGDK